MRQAITTKFIAPSNVKGSRVKASCQAGSLTLYWSHSLNSNENHMAAAQALANKLGWDGKWHGGYNKDGEGVFVHCDENYDAFTIERKQHVA